MVLLELTNIVKVSYQAKADLVWNDHLCPAQFPPNMSIFEVTYIEGVFLRSFKCGLLSFLKQVPKSKTDPDGNIKIKNLSNKKLDY